MLSNSHNVSFQIHKFGGASVKSAEALKNVHTIVETFNAKHTVIVISAMGKMTNAFERLLHSYLANESSKAANFSEIKQYHLEIIDELFEKTHSIYTELESIFSEISLILQSNPSNEYDFEYDRLVSYGEILSSTILAAYCNYKGQSAQWLDARELIVTDKQFRSANIAWKETQSRLCRAISASSESLFILQGFIGGTKEKLPTTLGREGSDFSAAIVAWALNANSVTVWKDVPGILNADPAFFTDAEKIERLSYRDAIELAFYGAKVIHPKTLKPLQNRDIPLHVKSFFAPFEQGTLISRTESEYLKPSFIIKKDQALLTISAKDFSFIAEKNLSHIFSLLHNHQLSVNLMQNSALSFSITVDNDEKKIPLLIDECEALYRVKYNYPVALITIWHYNDETIGRLTADKELLLTEKSRHTAQFVVRSFD